MEAKDIIKKPPLSEEAQTLELSMTTHWRHMESHNCDTCLHSYETLIKSWTAWVDYIKGEEKKEEERDGNEKDGEKGEKQTKSGAGVEKEDWEALFEKS